MATVNRMQCILLICLTLAYTSSSIQCFYCNSANNSACIDLSSFEDEEKFRIIPIVNCETAIPSPVAIEFFCRKIVQTIYHRFKDNEVRVTRGCGWIENKNPCYQISNNDHHEIVCGCHSNLCNASDSPDPALMCIIFVILASCLYFYRE
ncbi:unnamed protein product [Diatraea saccharalis]|uniref:Protein sleepless n=1 Tax=Diatraea saccharalis TaxID=40085 RepID=A0A9N9QT09_9NEOP|nr:unnamed protein product [Diatraea saccharalis]